MANKKFSQFSAAGALAGTEIVLLSRPSATITITAATISAMASDNSYNDSGNGFIAAGFAVGHQVVVQGFTGNAANNIYTGQITALTAGKMTIGGTDGNVIVDDAAGESVTISKWQTVRCTSAEVAGLAASSFTSLTDAPSSYSGFAGHALRVTAGEDGIEFVALGTAAAATLDTDGTLSANSDTRIPSQKAVKTYIDALIAAADAMVFKALIDCSANPNYPAADCGWTYRVSVAGKIGGGSGPNVEVGDILICLTDGTASGDHATVGSSWGIIQVNIDGALTTASVITEMFCGFISTPFAKDYKFVVKAAFGGTITESTTICASGTCTATFKINSTALGGTANSVSSSEQSQAHSSSNVFVAGDDIVVTVTSPSAIEDMSFTLKYTRALS